MVAAVVGRENAKQKFNSHTGVGRVSRRPFQIGGVLVQNIHFEYLELSRNRDADDIAPLADALAEFHS